MRWIAAVVVPVCLFGGACKSLKPPDSEQLAKLTDNQAEIYVGKSYRGLTPREIRVRREFGETTVTLSRGKKVLRVLDIEWSSRRSGSYLPYLFGVDTEGDALVYNIEDLEQSNDSTYVIPNLGVPIKVRDRQYGLTVWVED